MNEMKKTAVFVVAALLLTTTAVLATRPRVRTNTEFRDQGTPFFPAFKDPLACTALEVIDYDEATATPLPFKVMLKDGKWVIPSHHDYPADAKDRLAKTASGVIDLKKDVIVSDRPDQFEALGVVDPMELKGGLKGRGKRVTLRDKTGAVLADFLVGKEVPGRTGQRYVRVPGQSRTYAVNVNVDLSARFADWIETNLLKVDSSKLRKVTFDNHKVDPEQGTLVPGDVLTIDKKDASGPWTLEGLGPDQEVDPAKTSTLASSLADLKIVGVRQKPAGLTAALKATAEGSGIKLSPESRRSLATRGFYILRNGQLLSNQGDVIAQTEDGIVYTLRFGEVTFATGEALSAGVAEEAKSAADAKKKADAAESRFLFVTAEFDPKLVPMPQPAPKTGPLTVPARPFAREAGDKELAAQVKADREKEDREKAAHEKKLEDGRKLAKDLTNRFAAWYYLVPGDAFRDIVLDRAALVKKKGEQPKPEGGLPPGFNFPGGGGNLPGGLQLPNLPR